MIEYKFGNIICKIDWEIFLSLETNGTKLYKSDFKDFSHLYEYIDKNIKQINRMDFDGLSYILKKGLLHNLHGPAIKRYNKNGFMGPAMVYRYYINGRVVSTSRGKEISKQEEFKEELYYYEVINKTPKNGKRQIEGVDYKREKINIQQLIREEKLERILKS